MSKTIQIASHLNIALTEETLAEIAMRPGCDLRMPTRLKAYQLGGVAALIQLLITWGKKNPQGRLVTYIPNRAATTPQLDNLLTLDHGLVAVLRAADILLQDGSSCRADAIQFARRRIEAMEDGVDAAQRGPKVFLLCADDSSKAFLPSFYFQTVEKDVRGIRDFQLLATALLRKTWGFHPTSEPVPTDLNLKLGSILHELFENTHAWARTECDGTRVKRSLRGLRFELHRNTTDEFSQSAADAPPLGVYLSHQLLPRTGQMRRFVEISFFDSGPGLAQRMLGRCMDSSDTVDTELKSVLRCLDLHSTTSHHTHRGIGLHTVLTMLSDLRGFLRIRTGRLNLYRDFIEDTYNLRGENGEPVLRDWQTRTTEVTQCPRAEGTLLTMFVPINFRVD